MERSHQIESTRARIFDHIGAVIQCLASPARLRIVQILSNRPCTVETISQAAKESVANTSQHLQKLLKTGLVSCEKQGVNRLYRLANENVIDTWLSLQRLAGQLNPQILQDELILCPPDLMSDLDSVEVFKMLKKGKAVLVDVRDASEHESTPVPGSIHISSSDFESQYKKLPKSKTIFLFCRGSYCALANPAVELLRKKGYKAFRLKEMSYQLNQLKNETLAISNTK